MNYLDFDTEYLQHIIKTLNENPNQDGYIALRKSDMQYKRDEALKLYLTSVTKDTLGPNLPPNYLVFNSDANKLLKLNYVTKYLKEYSKSHTNVFSTNKGFLMLVNALKLDLTDFLVNDYSTIQTLRYYLGYAYNKNLLLLNSPISTISDFESSIIKITLKDSTVYLVETRGASLAVVYSNTDANLVLEATKPNKPDNYGLETGTDQQIDFIYADARDGENIEYCPLTGSVRHTNPDYLPTTTSLEDIYDRHNYKMFVEYFATGRPDQARAARDTFNVFGKHMGYLSRCHHQGNAGLTNSNF